MQIFNLVKHLQGEKTLHSPSGGEWDFPNKTKPTTKKKQNGQTKNQTEWQLDFLRPPCVFFKQQIGIGEKSVLCFLGALYLVFSYKLCTKACATPDNAPEACSVIWPEGLG